MNNTMTEIMVEDRAAPYYDKLFYEPPLMGMMQRSHAGMVPSGPDDLVLEIGCGSGSTIQNVTGRKFGVDISRNMIMEAAKKGIIARKASADRIPFESELFDITFFHATLHHIKDKKAALREAFRVTKTGGKVIIIDAVKNDSLTLKMLHGIFYPLQFFCVVKNRNKIEERKKLSEYFGDSPYHEPIKMMTIGKTKLINPLITHFEGLLYDGKIDNAIASFIFKTDRLLGEYVGGYGICTEITK